MATKLGDTVTHLLHAHTGRATLFAAALLLAFGSAEAWAQTAMVTGRVIDRGSSRGIAGATVEIQGTRLAATTNEDGRYQIANVPTGTRTVVARRLGYTAARETINVSAGSDASVDFALAPAATTLDAVVVTGTAGAEQRRAIGNSIATVDATEALSRSVAPNLGALLNARTPGVVVSTGTGRVGSGPAINIRGRSSIGLSNSPLIYIDGVRVDNAVGIGPTGTGGFSTQGSQVGGRLNDITPEDIERIEIIKGPAASTIYGTEASNGVIQIITKRGSGSTPQFRLMLQQGAAWFRDMEGRLPTNYARCTAAAVLPTSLSPSCHNRSAGDIVTWNAIAQEAARGRPLFKSGGTSVVNGAISGARNDVRYYVSSAYERDKGIEPNNSLQQYSTHANLDVAITPRIQLATSINYVDLRSRLGNDFGASAMLGAVFGHDVLFPASRGFALGFTPEITQDYWDNYQNVNRMTASGRLEHNPADWFRHRLQAGIDYTGDDSRNLERFIPAPVSAPVAPSTAAGRIGQTLRRGIGITLDYTGTLSTAIRGPLSQDASVGLQVYRREQDVSFLGGLGFPGVGIETVSGTAQPLASLQLDTTNTTVGAFFQEKLSWKDRLYLTGALRVDNNSAFGEDFRWVTYPKVDVSWVVSEEPFWRWSNAVSALRLRAAYGESGRQPNAFVALQTFQPIQGPGGSNAVTPGTIGNPDLRPERGKEFEVGFEAEVLDRLSLDFTYFTKKTEDLIINQPVAPSSGFSGTRPMNLGRVDNDGIELAATARILERPNFEWELFGNVATNGDVIKDLGGVPSLITAAGQFNAVGRPIAGIYSKRVVSADRNPTTGFATNVLCDGGPGQAPVACASAPFLFIGTPTPKLTGAVSNTLTLFNDWRLYALVDFKRGHRVFDQNEILRCTGALGAGMCEANFFPERYSPVYLAEIVGNAASQGIIDQYFESGSFVKLREISAAYTVPERWVRGASAATITLAARELHTWTKFRGLDPEVNVNGSASAFTGNQATTPPLTRIIASLNLTF